MGQAAGLYANLSILTLIVRPSIVLLLSLAQAASASSLAAKRTVPKPLQAVERQRHQNVSHSPFCECPEHAHAACVGTPCEHRQHCAWPGQQGHIEGTRRLQQRPSSKHEPSSTRAPTHLERPHASYTTSARSTRHSLNWSFSCCHVHVQGRLCTTTCRPEGSAGGWAGPPAPGYGIMPCMPRPRPRPAPRPEGSAQGHQTTQCGQEFCHRGVRRAKRPHRS